VKFFLSASALACALSFVAAGATPSAAASAPRAPNMTLNIDEPARNPFQQSVGIASGCTGPCNVIFSVVPTGKTLRITNVSCGMSVGDGNGLRFVYVSNGASPSSYAYVSSNIQGNSVDVVVNGAVNLYSFAGNTPVLTIDTNTSPVQNGQCTISGYTIATAA